MNYISKLSHPQTISNPNSRKRIALMGSTGTIGKNTLAIIKNTPQLFEIFALAGGKNIELLAQQALEFRPPLLAIQLECDFFLVVSLLPNH